MTIPNKKTHRANNSRELRNSVIPQKFEVRSNEDGSRSISGSAVVYSSLSEDLGGFRERISPGAFTKSLRNNPNIAICYNHDLGQVLGTVSSNTATVTDTPTALRFSCRVPQTSWGQDLAALMDAGIVDSMSFGFSCVRDAWSETPDGEIIRDVLE